ncbi:MAG: class I SAM-dependent methyltransferase [Chloroflexi bacterium]|nr:class I SAM-dependent methyltransferase [Chloroflexota bacterium]
MRPTARSPRKAQQQFGRQAAFYARSVAHSAGDSLRLLGEFASLTRYRVAVDLGTGAGFTAFAVAPLATHVVAMDVAPSMLDEARRLAGERGLANVGFALAEAESIPFGTGSVDGLTCRSAAHHFHDVPAAVAEVCRVLKTGGAFLLADTVAPEEDALNHWMNEVERRRDPSHQRDLKVSAWLGLLARTGLQVTHATMTTVELEFNDWVQRSGTPERAVEGLRRDFLTAPDDVKAAFGVQPRGESMDFRWPMLVARAVKA